jgi:hypothetical protein
MSSKERVIAALEHREPDRVPVGEMAIDFELTERALGRPTLYRSKWSEYTALWNGRRDEIVASYGRDIVDLVRHFDLDYLAIPLGPARQATYEPPEFIGEYSWRDAAGRTWQYSPESEGHAMCIDPIDMTADDIVMPPDPAPVDWSRLEHFEYIVKELGKSHFIMGRVPAGLFPWQETLGSVDGFLLKMYDEPSRPRRAMPLHTRRRCSRSAAMPSHPTRMSATTAVRRWARTCFGSTAFHRSSAWQMQSIREAAGTSCTVTATRGRSSTTSLPRGSTAGRESSPGSAWT